mmetsp:Transcript_3303/g.7164  ORF Transcript_3303/g.7164 Transcript_3303/m.7164 type:complete len:286 (-) Transcript_3303:148-1005(-)
MLDTLRRLKHNAHCRSIIKGCRYLHHKQQLSLRPNSDSATWSLNVKKALSSLLLHSKMFTIVYVHFEVVKRCRAEISKENGYPTLSADIFVLNTNLQERILKQYARRRSAEIGKCLTHSGDNLLWYANGRRRRCRAFFFVIVCLPWSLFLIFVLSLSIHCLSLLCLFLFSLSCRLLCCPRCGRSLCCSLLLRGARPSGLGNSGAILALLLPKPLFKRRLSPILERWHLSKKILHRLRTECLPHGRIFRRALLDLHIDRVSCLGQDRRDEGTALLVQIGEFGVGGD